MNCNLYSCQSSSYEIFNISGIYIYLYDDYLTLVINASKTPVSEKNIPLGGIEETLDESTAMGYSCSAQSLEAPPEKDCYFNKIAIFFYVF